MGVTCRRNDTVIYYFDGSANQYKIDNHSIEYKPVQKKESSSGFYSGGEPFQKEISQEEFSEFKKLIEQAITQKSEHHPRREMMTGMIILQFKSRKEKTYILKANSKVKQDIELFLRQFHPK